MYVFVYRHAKHRDELNEQLQTRILPFILDGLKVSGAVSYTHLDVYKRQSQTMRKGHDFKDFICPDTFEFEKDYFRMGDRYGRVIFLREYAAYIKDSMVAELCELNRNMMPVSYTHLDVYKRQQYEYL